MPRYYIAPFIHTYVLAGKRPIGCTWKHENQERPVDGKVSTDNMDTRYQPDEMILTLGIKSLKFNNYTLYKFLVMKSNGE